jgi:hypothetical protein
LSAMLNRQPVESKHLVGQVCKAHAQSLHLLVILPNLGMPKPLLQAEGLLDGFIKLPPKTFALFLPSLLVA